MKYIPRDDDWEDEDEISTDPYIEVNLDEDDEIIEDDENVENSSIIINDEDLNNEPAIVEEEKHPISDVRTINIENSFVATGTYDISLKNQMKKDLMKFLNFVKNEKGKGKITITFEYKT